jgi:hypothetical protein
MRLLTKWVNVSRQMPCAVPTLFEGTKRPIIPLLFFSNHNTNHLQIQTHSKVFRFLGSRMKGWNLLHKILKYVSFASAEMNSKNFFLEKANLYFVMMYALLQRLLDTVTAQLSDICLLNAEVILNLCFYRRGINSHLYP